MQLPTNLFVVDTVSGSLDNFSQYRTMALLTRTHFITLDSQNRYRVYSLSGTQDVTINHQLVQNVLDQLKPFLKFVIPGLLIFIFFTLFFLKPGWEMAYLLFFSLLFLLLTKLFSISVGYKKCYQLGMHLVVVYTTIFSLLSLVKIHFSLPFSQTIFLLALSTIVLNRIKLQILPKPALSSKHA